MAADRAPEAQYLIINSTALRVAGRSDTSASGTPSTLSPVEPLLLDAVDAAKLLGVTVRTF